MSVRAVVIASVVLAFGGASLVAQPTGGGQQGQQVGRRQGGQALPQGQGQGQQPQGRGGNRPPNREQLLRQIRENFTRRVQADLRLTDADMIRLAQVNRRFEAERSRLAQAERRTRFDLRRELDAPDSVANAASQARVGELLDEMLRITRSRIDIVEQEQRELAAFMTPVQRARYQGMVESLQRRLDDILDGRGGRGGGRGDGRGDGRQGPRGGGPPPPRGAGPPAGAAVPPPPPPR